MRFAPHSSSTVGHSLSKHCIKVYNYIKYQGNLSKTISLTYYLEKTCYIMQNALKKWITHVGKFMLHFVHHINSISFYLWMHSRRSESNFTSDLCSNMLKYVDKIMKTFKCCYPLLLIKCYKTLISCQWFNHNNSRTSTVPISYRNSSWQVQNTKSLDVIRKGDRQESLSTIFWW